MAKSFKFNFYEPGREAPEVTYVFSFLGIILLFILSVLGISLWLSHVIFGTVAGIALALVLYLLVRKLELIKVGQDNGQPILYWVLLVATLGFTILMSYHYLANVFPRDDGSTTHTSMKLKEYSATSALYSDLVDQLDMMKTCSQIQDIDGKITQAALLREEFGNMETDVKNPINIMSVSKPIGEIFTRHKAAILASFNSETLGSCADPSPVFKSQKFDNQQKQYGPISSLKHIILKMLLPLLILIPILILLPYLLAKSQTAKLGTNQFKDISNTEIF